MLLREYAITPDVFDATSYSSEEVAGLHLQTIREVMMAEGLVRNLRGGEWLALFANVDRSWHRRGKELLKKLKTQGRLINVAPSSLGSPDDDLGWCEEALASHQSHGLTGGIIVTESVKAAHPNEPVVARVDKLTSAPWWTNRSSSVRLKRTISDYRAHLSAVLCHANSILFIDPYLDPARQGYRQFGELVHAIGTRKPAPIIEIHRVCWEESRDQRLLPEFQERISANFERALGNIARRQGLRIDVFLWDYHHDRYVISDLVGIHMSNGFDTTTRPGEITTWSRLGRDARDDIQREFDPANIRHQLKFRFSVGS